MLNRLRSPTGQLRAAWLVVCAAAVLLRLAVPAGWMPVFDAGGARLIVCDGMGAFPVAASSKHGHHMPGHGRSDPTSLHPCAFAGLGLAVAFAPPVAALAVVPTASAPAAQQRAFIAVGRGLAAPPPPATGPPAFV